MQPMLLIEGLLLILSEIAFSYDLPPNLSVIGKIKYGSQFRAYTYLKFQT